MLNLYVKAQTFLNGLKNEDGQDLIEYALLAALIAMVCVVAIKALSTKIGAAFTAITFS